MKFNPLAHTGIQLPEICLGTMTFGEQNTQAEAFEQLNYALDQGLYFWDTAEMYQYRPKQKHKVQLSKLLATGSNNMGSVIGYFLHPKLLGLVLEVVQSAKA
jgi:aryl-alcohol dehydrogenase-like predicted oxidoreductase